MIKRRLLILADHLEKVGKRKNHPRKFDLREWWIKFPDCGTQCCAVGEATTIPEFKKLGLLRGALFGGSKSAPQYGDLCDWAAVQAFFGLRTAEAEHLFSMHFYFAGARTNPRVVADRIREFVENGGL